MRSIGGSSTDYAAYDRPLVAESRLHNGDYRPGADVQSCLRKLGNSHITERGLRVADVAERLGVSAHSLYAWVKRYSKPQIQRQQVDDQQAELRRLRAELKRVTEERDILKKAAAYFAKESG